MLAPSLRQIEAKLVAFIVALGVIEQKVEGALITDYMQDGGVTLYESYPPMAACNLSDFTDGDFDATDCTTGDVIGDYLRVDLGTSRAIETIYIGYMDWRIMSANPNSPYYAPTCDKLNLAFDTDMCAAYSWQGNVSIGNDPTINSPSNTVCISN